MYKLFYIFVFYCWEFDILRWKHNRKIDVKAEYITITLNAGANSHSLVEQDTWVVTGGSSKKILPQTNSIHRLEPGLYHPILLFSFHRKASRGLTFASYESNCAAEVYIMTVLFAKRLTKDLFIMRYVSHSFCKKFFVFTFSLKWCWYTCSQE